MTSPSTGLDEARRILVIKLGAFGDFLLALAPMQALRAHNPAARLTLLTTPPYAKLAQASGLFQDILIDRRPGWSNLGGFIDLRRRLRAEAPDFVVDLQTSDRSSFYRHLFWPDNPNWSGIAKGCSHPHANPNRDHLHTLERQAEQLRMAGLPDGPLALPDLSFLDGDITGLGVPERFALLVPGGAPSRPEKRWPAARYGAYAAALIRRGLRPVILGTADEAEAAATILAAAPESLSLLGRTDFGQIAALARRADHALGNDTGPMHLIALAGCPSTVLFSHASDPALCGPRGRQVTILRATDLGALEVEVPE